MLNQPLQLSPTVELVQRKLAEEKTVAAAVDVVRQILERHPEYGNHAAPMSLIPSKRGENKSKKGNRTIFIEKRQKMIR
jgi:hypothetical protein